MGFTPPQSLEEFRIAVRQSTEEGTRYRNAIMLGPIDVKDGEITSALEKAVAKAKPSKRPIVIETGYYRSRPVPISGTNHAVTIRAESWNLTPLEGVTGGGSIIELMDGMNASLFDVSPECGPCNFIGLVLLGNQAKQTTGTSRAIRFLDAASPRRSGTIMHCRMERWRSGALSVGTFRDAGKIHDTQLLTCGFDPDGAPVGGAGADGALFGSCNDWRLTWVDSGAHTRFGVYFTGAGTVSGKINSFFSNRRNGVRIDGTAQGINLDDGLIDRNGEEGIVITGSTSTTKAFVRKIQNYTFTGNGNSEHNTFADIRIVDDPNGFTVFDGPTFSKGGFANLPKYCIQTTGTTTGVDVIKPKYLTGESAPYAAAFTNDESKLVIT